MKHGRTVLFIRMLAVSTLFGCLTGDGWAGETCQHWVAKIVSVQGDIQVRRAGGTDWHDTAMNDTFCPGDMIRTHENSRAAFLLINEATLRLDQNTAMTFTGLEKETTLLLMLLRGAAYIFSRLPRSLKIATPFVNGNIEGTEFLVNVEPDHSIFSVFEGRVTVTNSAGGLSLARGQTAIARRDSAPALRLGVLPRNAVQWTLYYPPYPLDRTWDIYDTARADWRAPLKASIQAYEQGRITSAISHLAGIPDQIGDPRFFTYRASLLLTVGRAEAAEVDLEKALGLDSRNSRAYALKSIIAVARNNRTEALDLAAKAVELDPESASAKVALSYARQSLFDLQGALKSLQEAVQVDPQNALAWARLSEMRLSFGYLDSALAAARKAVDIDPGLERTQTVLGFAYLTQIKLNNATAAFDRAIALDASAPLPRLGLGLAKIREGQLGAGTDEIAIAASLDPVNALTRSYLGKAFFDEKRAGRDGTQFAIAKELDPQDPTAWFYDAVRKQTINRPVEALHDFQRAIELNGNRAVYRSRLLLDGDLAARSAGLGRIYNDLGFQQSGLVQGWRSVNTDPANYSAHRLLADLYAALPRHEIARVSELLQSQLLQPLNIAPVQPGLAEPAGSLILEGAGPGVAAFNEFNPLFVRNRFALQASGLAGQDDTYGGELVQSTVWNRFSYSLGLLRYVTDGFRENSDLDQDVYNVFAQYSLSPQSSIQAEYRYTDKETGQIDLLFDPDISPRFRNEEKGESVRFGFHHGFSPGSDVIGSFIYQSVDLDQNKTTGVDAEPPFAGAMADTRFEEDRDGFIAELQYLHRSEKFNLIGGAGYTDQDVNTRAVIDLFDVVLPPPPFLPGLPPIVLDPPASSPIIEDTDMKRANVYAYSQIRMLDDLSLTVGLSADSLEWGDQLDAQQLNPKLGLTWQPLPATTLRAAAIRELGNRLFFSQTIEPTQVAGFNQFFDDVNGTDAWRYGVAIDQTFSTNLYGGAAYSFRDLSVPLLSAPGFDAQYFDWDEQFGRAYVYWTPHPMAALSAEYQYERFDRKDNPFQTGIVDVNTHRLPLGFNFFHPSGMAFGLKGTYVHQSGDFQKRDASAVFYGRDDFWVIDAVVQYRLPKRYGLLSVGIDNIFDTGFQYQDTDPANPTVRPERCVFGSVSLSF